LGGAGGLRPDVKRERVYRNLMTRQGAAAAQTIIEPVGLGAMALP